MGRRVRAIDKATLHIPLSGIRCAIFSAGAYAISLTTEVEITFDAQVGGNLRTVVQSGFPNIEMRDFFTQMPRRRRTRTLH